MSAAAERAEATPRLPAAWERLERAAEAAAQTTGAWRKRALDAEEEVAQLRRILEDLGSTHGQSSDLKEQIRRTKAENAALRSRMAQAHKRVDSLLARLSAVEARL